MNPQKSEQMITIQKEIEVNAERSRALIECRRAVCSFVPQTKEGQEALDKELVRIERELDEAQQKYNDLRGRLEVETVQHLGGKGTAMTAA